MRMKFWSFAGMLVLTGLVNAQPPAEAARATDHAATPGARDCSDPESVAARFGSASATPTKSLSRLSEELGEQAVNPMVGFAVGHALGASIPLMIEEAALPIVDFASGFRNGVLKHMTVPLGTVRNLD